MDLPRVLSCGDQLTDLQKTRPGDNASRPRGFRISRSRIQRMYFQHPAIGGSTRKRKPTAAGTRKYEPPPFTTDSLTTPNFVPMSHGSRMSVTCNIRQDSVAEAGASRKSVGPQELFLWT